MIHLYGKMITNPTKITESERTALYHLYDADIKYIDDVIGWLLDNLQEWLDNTIVILAADHGDEFGEHGRFSHRSVYDGIIRIPLILTGPGIRPGTIVRGQVGLEDLAPTIIEMAGLNRVEAFRGESLMPFINGKAGVNKSVISTTVPPTLPKQLIIAYRKGDWKYIRTESVETPGAILGEELYDLKKDPGETNSLYGTRAQAARRFEQEAKEKISLFKRYKLIENTAYEKERVKKRLRKLTAPDSHEST
jgi:arylsulfatase A-like enzyme